MSNFQQQLPPLKTAAQIMQNINPQPIIQSQGSGNLHQNQMSIQEQSSALSGALINMDARDNEFVHMLTSQLGDKDAKIRKLQQQVDDYSKSRLFRLQ